MVRPTAQAEDTYKQHLDEAAMARDKLYDWKHKAKVKPWKYAEMMCDGMTKNGAG